MPFEAREATIATVQQSIFSGQSTCRQVTEAFLARIVALNSHVNAIIALNPQALEDADVLDAALAAGHATGSLFGVPILLKDNFDTANMPTTGGCLALAASQPAHDAPTVTALKRAGAVILGKTNMHELALEGLTVSSLGGQTVNPYDASRTAGGSSGGSGAAVAMSFAVLATGTDTVNSLRNPASANSLCSCRPTRGLVSRKGIIPVSSTQDAAGAIARCVADVAVALTVMKSVGCDAGDGATALVPDGVWDVDYAATVALGNLRGLRLGLVEGFFDRRASDETTPVNEAMDGMVSMLKKAGAAVVSINETTYNSLAISSQLDVQRFEYREQLTGYLQGQHGNDDDVPDSMPKVYSSGDYLVIPEQYEYIKTALEWSTSSGEYDEVRRGISKLTLALQETFEANRLDALVYPEQSNLVVKIGSRSQSGRNGILAAVTGWPVVVVPAGFSEARAGGADKGVPIGMEVLGRPFSEEKLLQMGHGIEGLARVRRIPGVAEQEVVEAARMASVPVVGPFNKVDSGAYPIGML